MLRSSIYTASALLLGASAFAQSDLSSRILPITAPLKDAGTLNLATGQWTRHGHLAQAGSPPGTVYNNTCDTGYYGAIEATEVFVDEGRLPSTSSPNVDFTPGLANGSSRRGCLDRYDIDGFQIGYCTDQTNFDLEMNFYTRYITCDPTGTPNVTFALDNIPGGGSPPALACWLVTFDLNAPPQTASLVFNMIADSDGAYDGDLTLDLFGWDFTVTSTLPAPSASGFIIAGDEFTCSGYDGTIFDNPVNVGQFPNGEEGTGMDTQDAFRIDPITAPPGAVPGCYFFGGAPGNPMGSFHIQLYQTQLKPCNTAPGESFCVPGDDAALCPCFTSQGQIADPGHGCGNSVFTGGAILTSSGSDTTIGADDVTLTLSDIPATVSCIYLQGNADISPGAVFGDGRRCAGGTLIRIGQKIDNGCGVGCQPTGGDDVAVDNSTSLGAAAGEGTGYISSAGGVSTTGGIGGSGQYIYQGYYRNPNPTWCPSATFNVSQGQKITWQ